MGFAVVFGGFVVLVLMLLIQYRVVIYRRSKQTVASNDTKQHVNSLNEIRKGAITHAANTCMNYVMFVWAVIFTKAFQGLHCIPREHLVLAQDLGLVCIAIVTDFYTIAFATQSLIMNAGVFPRCTLGHFHHIFDFACSSDSISCSISVA